MISTPIYTCTMQVATRKVVGVNILERISARLTFTIDASVHAQPVAQHLKSANFDSPCLPKYFIY